MTAPHASPTSPEDLEGAPWGAHTWRCPVPTSDGLQLGLTRVGPPREGADAVLLLHGASASSRTFVVPFPTPGSDEAGGLAGYLGRQGYEVWALDWRGNGRIARRREHFDRWERFTFDASAAIDVPTAIDVVREHLGSGRRLHVVGHCVGSAILAMALGGGHLKGKGIERVVLLTLGLFYRQTWDGWTKADDQLMEALVAEAPECRFIDPDAGRYPWPTSLEAAYASWPRSLLPEAPPDDVFRRLCFMFGRPFLFEKVPPPLRGPEELRRQFGGMPLALYIQAGQMVRRGFAAPYDDVTWSLDRRRPASTGGRLDPAGAGRYLQSQHFAGLQVTLITGARNTLWHPDSVNAMADWLRRGAGSVRVRRHVLADYAHQDLLWSADAERDVYPLIEDGLKPQRDLSLPWPREPRHADGGSERSPGLDAPDAG